MPNSEIKISEDGIRLNIAFFFIGFFIASIILFERFFSFEFGYNIIHQLLWLVYFGGYGFGSLLLLIYVSLRSVHYKYLNPDKFGSRDQFVLSNFKQSIFYDLGVEIIISSFALSVIFIIIANFIRLLQSIT